jgi:hypothetical protein
MTNAALKGRSSTVFPSSYSHHAIPIVLRVIGIVPHVTPSARPPRVVAKHDPIAHNTGEFDYQVSPPALGGQAFRARRMVAIWPVW